MKTKFYSIGGAVCLVFTSCSIDVEQDHSITAAAPTANSMSLDVSREIVRTSIGAELAKEYFVATSNEGSSFTAYSRVSPSRDQIQVLIPPHVESESTSKVYSFRVLNRGSRNNAQAASRLARTIRGLAEAAANTSRKAEAEQDAALKNQR